MISSTPAARAFAASSRACSLAALGEQPAARLGTLVREHDVGAELGCGDRSRQPGGAAADHEHVRVAAPVLGAPLALGLRLAQPAEPRGGA